MKLNVNLRNFCFKLILLLGLTLNISLAYRFKYKSKTDLKKLAYSLTDTQTLSISSNNIERNNESSDVFEGSVFINSHGDLSFANKFLDKDYNNDNKKIIARARYTKSLAEIGWSRLYVETFDNTSPEIQSWAAGFLEGKLTAQEILYFYKNLVGIHKQEESLLGQVFDYYTKVENFIRRKTSKSSLINLDDEELRYWTSVAMIQAQTDGLLNGYNSIMTNNRFELNKIYFINADGEVPELIEVFKQKNKSSGFYSRFKERGAYKKFSKGYLKKYFGTSNPDRVWRNLMMNSHCSAVIKVVNDEYDEGAIKDIIVGHTTWDSYSEMQRIYKVYKFSFTLLEKQENPVISFSSYAGTLTSTDDYYVLNSGLVVLETTLEILDRTLYDRNIPSAEAHVPNYIRISVANRLAKDGKHWTQIFKKNNSGTYNSQWMIIDLNKLKTQKRKQRYRGMKNKFLKMFNEDLFSFKQFYPEEEEEENVEHAGLFHVLEQIPGTIQVKDMTSHLLKQRYWGSYNRPFFPNIFKISGYEAMMHRYGNNYSYENNPRAKLIRGKINDINNIEDFKSLMQSNLDIDGQVAVNTISPRFDITGRGRLTKPSGGIDSKITNLEMGKNMEVLAISGPTHQSVRPFDWEDWNGKNYPHYGLPNVWNFDWVKMDIDFVKNN